MDLGICEKAFHKANELIASNVQYRNLIVEMVYDGRSVSDGVGWLYREGL